MHELVRGIGALAGKGIVAAEAIAGGLSSDRKYYIEAASGERMLLRMSAASNLARKQTEYEMTAHAFAHNIPVPRPLGFGLCENAESCYSLFGWIDGIDAETAMAGMSPKEQYILGLKSGVVLQKIHSVPVPAEMEKYADGFERKVKKWIDLYNAKPQVHCEIGEMLVRYLQERRDAIALRPQTFIHGDFNTENIIVRPDGEISVIDFNSYNTMYGDPWEELNSMAWMPKINFDFQSGQINAYFNGEPPAAFWKVFHYDLAYTALTALTDAYGLNGIENGMEIVERILTCYPDIFPGRLAEFDKTIVINVEDMVQ